MLKVGIALILIILGLILIALPFLGLVPVAVLSGFFILMLGIGLILAGIKEMGENEGANLGISLFILGIIALILSIGFVFSPAIFAWMVGFIFWIICLFLIIAGVVRILSKTGDNRCGFKDIIIGLIILFVGLFLATYTWLLGVLIGLWLLSTGIRILHNPQIFIRYAHRYPWQ
jgi:membrane protein HdeD